MQKRLRQQHVHPMVAKVAMEIAHEIYAGLMTNDVFYSGWKRMNPGMGMKELEKKFCQQTVGQVIPQARATLAAMLAGSLPEEVKEKIAEALFLDNTLDRGRMDGRAMRPMSQLVH